jgi:Xaa-Pro aminopeptidase
MDRYQLRRDRLRKLLGKAKVDSLLVTNFTNVTYLTGFTGDDSYLLISPGQEVILSDPRYTTQLAEECPGIELAIRDTGKSMLDTIDAVLTRRKPAPLGIEAQSISVALRDRIAAALPKVELAPTDGLVERLRLIKDKDEVDVIRRAARVAERAFEALRASIRPELTEKQVADDLEHQMRLLGAKCSSFPPIVAVGPRAALPHARPTSSRLSESPLLLVDWGADVGGYKSDLTRVLTTGKISPKLERVYRVVLMAQEQGIAAVRPGVTAHEVDAAARSVIEKAGYGKYFGHGLGHGIGLDIHEAPRLGVNQSLVLEAGMVVTIEPGVYLPEIGGVRIEDDVLVTKTGHELLTSAAKQWEDTLVAW